MTPCRDRKRIWLFMSIALLKINKKIFFKKMGHDFKFLIPDVKFYKRESVCLNCDLDEFFCENLCKCRALVIMVTRIGHRV